MKNLIVALSAGIIMGLGLSISRMIDPVKVINFLDVTGNWDPSLAFVMMGALIINIIAFRLSLKSKKPVCAAEFSVPANQRVDLRLLSGASLFGVGWGLAGICPAPAIAGLGLGIQKSYLFFFAMIIGMLLYKILFKTRQ